MSIEKFKAFLQNDNINESDYIKEMNMSILELLDISENKAADSDLKESVRVSEETRKAIIDDLVSSGAEDEIPMIEKLFELCDLYAKYSTKYDGKEQTGVEIVDELYAVYKSDLENLDVNDLIKQFDDRIELLKLAYENV